MKNALYAIGALSLASIAAAQPQHRRHEHLHQRREADVVTFVDYVTATAPEVIVYVNEDGEPVSTSTVGVAAATSPAAYSLAAASPSAYTSAAASPSVAPAHSHHHASPHHPSPHHSSASAASPSAYEPSSSAAAASPSAYQPSSSSAAPVSSTSSAAASSSSSSGSSRGSAGYGISYSPYSGSYSAGNVNCKTTAEVQSDFDQISGYGLTRIYGTDCNQVANVLAAAAPKNMKVFVGIFDITQVAAEVSIISSAVNGDWSDIYAINVGNELVNQGSASVSAVVAAVKQARSLLRAAGYNGPVVTVDTFDSIIANPALCEASDFAAANAHPFFDPTIPSCEAGKWLADTKSDISTACGGMDTMITETGYPTGGDSNGLAIPSKSDQSVALETIKGNVSESVIFFTAFNDMWKAPGYLNIEQSWGILN